MSIFTPRPAGLCLADGAGPEARPRTEARDPTVKLWDYARWMWDQITGLLADEPGPLAEREFMQRREYDVVRDWVRHLELLVRRLILVLALSFDPGPLKPAMARGPRERRCRLLWPHKPHEWPARFHMIPRRRAGRRIARKPDPERYVFRAIETWPIARRIETLRRILAEPMKRARRFAFTLARIRARNATANERREFALRRWRLPENCGSGARAIDRQMGIVEPIAEDAIDRWQGSG